MTIRFINNYIEPVALAVDQTSATLALPDGKYRLTVADSSSAATQWEILDAVVAGGVATLDRAKEETPAQEWAEGSVIYNALTAETLNLILADIHSLKPVEPASEDLVLEVMLDSTESITTNIAVWTTAGGLGASINISDGQSFEFPAGDLDDAMITLTGHSTITIGGDLDGVMLMIEAPTKLISWGKEIKGAHLEGRSFEIWQLSIDFVEVPSTLPAWITSLEGFFRDSSSFNQDISMWNTAAVENMDDMLLHAELFNQDLSAWCVPLIPSEPTNFATFAGAWVLPKPVWGTCPS